MKLKYGIIFLLQLIAFLSTITFFVTPAVFAHLEVQIALICGTIILGLQFAAIVKSVYNDLTGWSDE